MKWSRDCSCSVANCHSARTASLLGIVLLCVYQQVAPVISTIPPGCAGRMDVVFIIDSSESVVEHDPFSQPLYHWGKLQELLTQVIQSLPVDSGDTRLGLLSYSHEPEGLLALNSYQTASSATNLMQSLQPRRGATNTAAALSYTSNVMFGSARSDARRVVVLISDGLSNWERENVLARASELKGRADVHTVAITPYIDETELRNIASSQEQFLQVHLDLVDYYAQTLTNRLCELPDPEPPTPTPPVCGSHCAVCDGTGHCTECEAGYHWTDDVGQCVYDCELRADLVILADNSGSIRDKDPCDTCDNYVYLKEFLVSLVRAVNVGPDFTRVSAIRFSSTAVLEFDLDDYGNLQQVETAIWNMAYEGSYTNIAHAIRMAREDIFVESRGDRPDVRNVAILITDGESNVNQSFTLYEADLAKASGVSFFVVGMTNAINELELRSISSEPVSQHFFESADVQSLSLLQEELVRLVCSGSYRAKRSSGSNTWGIERSGGVVHGSLPHVVFMSVLFSIICSLWTNGSERYET